MRRATQHDGEQGFTIIEMVIVLIVLALAMAVVFPAVGNMLRNTSRATASTQATGEAGVAAQLLENDIKVALGDRGTGDRTDTSRFAGVNAIRLATIPSLHAGATDNRYPDIVTAGPLRLILNADVYERAGVEQVEWRLVEDDQICGDTDDSNRNFCVTRTVRGPGGAPVLTVEVPVKSRGTYAASAVDTCGPGITGKRLFCYQQSFPGNGNSAALYVWNGGWTASCTATWTAAGTNPNTTEITVTSAANRFTTQHNAVDPAGSISRLDRITQIGATLISGGGYGKAAERSYEHLTTSIRARENEPYKEAIMCGRRAGWGR